jgi:hypothetical protein
MDALWVPGLLATVVRPYTTAGEDLAAYLARRHITSFDAVGVASALLSTGRGDDWAEAVHEMAVLHLVRRLVAAGSKVASTRPEWDYVVESEIKQMILDTMIVDYNHVAEVYARLEPAVVAARSTISPGTRKQLRSESQRERPWCYLCGSELDYEAKESPSLFTLDHIWPQAFGGNSDPENLIPACRACNQRKGHSASWSLYPVQALVHGYRLSSDEVEKLPKEARFAVLARTANAEATATGVSLKEAFVRLGRPELPSVLDESVSVDVFNLVANFS